MSDGETVSIVVNGAETRVPARISVAAALIQLDTLVTQRSTTGEPRGPLCGIGICFECRATIDGAAHRRTCLVTVTNGMTIVTEGGRA